MAKAVVETLSLLCEVEEVDGRVRILSLLLGFSDDSSLTPHVGACSLSATTLDSATRTRSSRRRLHSTLSSPS